MLIYFRQIIRYCNGNVSYFFDDAKFFCMMRGRWPKPGSLVRVPGCGGDKL